VLTLAFLIKLGFPLMSVTQISSLVPAFLCVLITGWWGQRRFGVVWGSLAALALALSQSFSYWGRSGMETPAFALFILLALIAAAEGQWRVMGLSACLIAVTRPEGIIYLVPLFAHAAMVVWRDNRTLKDLVVPVLLAVAPLAAWVLFRLVYFHEILPNTYYAKMDGMRLAQVQRGLEYLYGFLRISEIQVLQLLILAMLIVEIVRRRGRPSRDWIYSWQVLGAGMMVCTVVFVLSSGGDWMNQHRFTQPTLPVFILMGVAAGFALGNAPSGKVTKLLTTLMLALVFASQPVRVLSHDLRHPVHPLDRALGLVEPWDDSTTSNLYRLGLSMREVAPPGTTIALCPVGAFSVAWGGTVIHMLGTQ
jgi:hypothetical protein